MFEIPPLDSVATASLFVGLLFVLRYFLAMRRIWLEVGRPRGFVFGDYFRATKPGAYGTELEPNRRYAVRQLYLAAFFLGAALLLFAWLLASGMPVRLAI